MYQYKARTAKKDYPDFGIKQGEIYYLFKGRFGWMEKSKIYPSYAERRKHYGI